MRAFAAQADPAAALDRAIVAERRRALRALLRTPLLGARGPDPAAFWLVRKHAPWLREWLARNAGWSLYLDAELARLRKTPADLSDGSRPARARRGDAPFSRRRYVLLCLALAALEREDRQIVLGRLAEQVVALVAGDPALAEAGICFDLAGRDQRRDLVAVVRLLLALGILVRVDGDEEAYLAERGDVLYTINRPALATLLSVKRGPSMVEAADLAGRLDAITAEPLPDTDEGRLRRLRTRLTRRLLDDPVVYYDQLDADELDYLHRTRATLLREVTEATGLIAEVRAEGIAMVDDRGDLTDLGLPEEGTDGHLTLLLAEHLAASARTRPGTPVSRAALHQRVAELIAEHRHHWRKGLTEPGADQAIADEVITRLAALQLVRLELDGVVPLPAIARYALDQAREPEPTALF
ncbi:MAG: TIGR02678 family protein [Egibacteraceae bacterium]